MKSYKISASILAAIILTLSVLCLLLPKQEISEAERRKLAEFPKFSVDSFIKGSFAKDFETYSTDNFPFRDAFRAIKAGVNYKVFAKSDNNDIYIKDGSMMKLEKELDEASVANAMAKFESIYEKYIKGKTDKIYSVTVPDKAYFPWFDGDSIPSLDYDRLYSLVYEGMPYATHINIIDLLDLSDFYDTDSHWRQEKILDVAERIMLEMGNSEAFTYTEVDTGIDFKGVYSGQAALPGVSEKLSYLTNEILESAKTTNLEANKTYNGVYDTEKLTSRDPYEYFLSGASAMLTIENPKNGSGKELVIFRDSYGSSIAPLFVPYYSKVTLLDIRYMNPEFIGQLASFEDADVLFLYSTTLMNSSSALR